VNAIFAKLGQTPSHLHMHFCDIQRTHSYFSDFLTSMPLFVKIDQEVRPWKCGQTDTRTDARKNDFINCHLLCYSL